MATDGKAYRQHGCTLAHLMAIALALTAGQGLRAQEWTLRVDNLNFFVNDEYSGGRLDGYTLPGFVLRPRVVWQADPRIHVEAGANWLHYWGAKGYPSNQSLAVWNFATDTTTAVHLRPWLQARVDFTPHLSVVVGSIVTGEGHGLPLPLYNPERVYAADPESGLQLLADYDRVQADVWVDWREFIWQASPTQEQFTVGLTARGSLPVSEHWELYVPLHFIACHNGGEGVADTTATIRNRLNGAVGLGATWRGADWRLTAEMYAMGYLNSAGEERDNVYNEYGMMTSPPIDFKRGWGLYPCLKAQYRGVEAEASYWTGEKFVPLLGAYHYSNVSSNVENMTHDRIQVLTLRGRYTWRTFANTTVALEGAFYHYFPFTGDRTNFWKVEAEASSMYSVGLFVHLHPTFRLSK